MGSRGSGGGWPRRRVLEAGAALAGTALAPGGGALAASTVTLPMANGERPLRAYPGKRELMVLTERPVQLETPMPVFDEGVLTPNDAFFVRWHLAGMPTRIDGATFRLRVRGRVSRPLELSVEALRTGFEPVEVVAVCQCSGNGRGLFEPRVPGGQWGNGAMGNARWRGVRLRDLLERAGIADDAVQVRFNGADRPLVPATPDFAKSLDLDVALRDDVIVAWAMNGEPLPLLNGFPLRLVVPGWYATYWVKMLNDIEVLAHPDEGFWMKPAYRIPDNPCACVPPGTRPQRTVPINRMTTRSFITHPGEGATLARGRAVEVRGIAFDGGFGIARVLFSADGGRRWATAELGEDLGPYSFRRWRARFVPEAAGERRLVSVAINGNGEAQRLTPRWNPSGYTRNVIEPVRVAVR